MPETCPSLLAWQSHLGQYLIGNDFRNKAAVWDTVLRLNDPALPEDIDFVRQFWGVVSLPTRFEQLYKLTNGFSVTIADHKSFKLWPIELLPNCMQRCFEMMVAHPLTVGHFLPFINECGHPYGYLRNEDGTVDDILWGLDIDVIGESLANPETPITKCFCPAGDLWSFFQ